MMLTRVILALAVCLFAPSIGWTEIIYDASTYAPSGWSIWPPAGAELGDEITFDYMISARTVTLVEVGVVLSQKTGSVDCALTLYNWNYDNGLPGSMLWTGSRYDVAIANYALMVPFDVPNVVVPERAVWTLEFLGGDSAGISGAAAPKAGGCYHGWRWYGGAWTTVGYPHVARITAIPEPGVLTLLVLGGLALPRRRRAAS